MAAMDIEEEEMSRQVQVRFITKLKAPLKAPNTTIAIPSNLTRMGLSTLVNTLLQSSAPGIFILTVFFLLILYCTNYQLLY